MRAACHKWGMVGIVDPPCRLDDGVLENAPMKASADLVQRSREARTWESREWQQYSAALRCWSYTQAETLTALGCRDHRETGTQM